MEDKKQQASAWFERTIEREDGGPPTSQESEGAMLMIATMYDEGQGETRSPKRATNWIVRAAQGRSSRRSTRDNAAKRCGNSAQRSSACDALN
jgi:TPR repeat protein